MIYGRPGVGKSRSLVEYAVREMTSYPISILCSRNVTVRYFVQEIAGVLGFDERTSSPRLENMIAEKLRRSPRALFVDQANFLDERGLGTVCHIWEKARTPTVLVGTKALFDRFMSSRMTEDVRAQLSSRVALHYP
ncbi:MAG: AAA family ATPase, partial [Blastocatellia bacterium]